MGVLATDCRNRQISMCTVPNGHCNTNTHYCRHTQSLFILPTVLVCRWTYDQCKKLTASEIDWTFQENVLERQHAAKDTILYAQCSISKHPELRHTNKTSSWNNLKYSLLCHRREGKINLRKLILVVSTSLHLSHTICEQSDAGRRNSNVTGNNARKTLLILMHFTCVRPTVGLFSHTESYRTPSMRSVIWMSQSIIL